MLWNLEYPVGLSQREICAHFNEGNLAGQGNICFFFVFFLTIYILCNSFFSSFFFSFFSGRAAVVAGNWRKEPNILGGGTRSGTRIGYFLTVKSRKQRATERIFKI